MIRTLQNAELTRQSYGLKMSQCVYGGPRGVWLECISCPESQTIIGSRAGRDTPNVYMDATDAQLAEVFRRHGWTGIGATMLRARCPMCADG